MEIINPLAGSLAQSSAVTRQQSTDKSQQIRRAQALRKDVAAASDTFEPHVESCEEDTPIHDEQRKKQPRRKPRGAKQKSATTDKTAEPPHLDLTA